MKVNEHVLLVARQQAMHRVIARRIRKSPALLDIPRDNLKRWMKMDLEQAGRVSALWLEWDRILRTRSVEEILEILESDDPKFERLQHGSPFAGILSQEEVMSFHKKKKREHQPVPA